MNLFAQPEKNDRLNRLLSEFDKNLEIVKKVPLLEAEKERIRLALIEAKVSAKRKDSLFNRQNEINEQIQELFLDEIEGMNQIKAMGNSGVWGSIVYMSMDALGGESIQKSIGTKLSVSGVIMLTTYAVDWWPYDFWKIEDPTGILKLIGL